LLSSEIFIFANFQDVIYLITLKKLQWSQDPINFMFQKPTYTNYTMPKHIGSLVFSGNLHLQLPKFQYTLLWSFTEVRKRWKF